MVELDQGFDQAPRIGLAAGIRIGFEFILPRDRGQTGLQQETKDRHQHARSTVSYPCLRQLEFSYSPTEEGWQGVPLSQTVIEDGLAQAAATYTQLPVETSLNPFASDHVPFINAQIPAVLTIEGADNANNRIHSANDTLNKIDYEIAQEILRMNVGFIASEIGRIS